MSSQKFWISVASRDHVISGVSAGICQACHGKAAPLRRMSSGDLIAYYSSKMQFGKTFPCQAFTAIGQVSGDEIFSVNTHPEFTVARRAVNYLTAQEANIATLIEGLEFITNKKHWGAPFRYGFLQIGRDDFVKIARAMKVENLERILV